MTGLHIPPANNPSGRLISMAITTLAGQIYLNFNYNEEIVSLERVVTATMRLLR